MLKISRIKNILHLDFWVAISSTINLVYINLGLESHHWNFWEKNGRNGWSQNASMPKKHLSKVSKVRGLSTPHPFTSQVFPQKKPGIWTLTLDPTKPRHTPPSTPPGTSGPSACFFYHTLPDSNRATDTRHTDRASPPGSCLRHVHSKEMWKNCWVVDIGRLWHYEDKMWKNKKKTEDVRNLRKMRAKWWIIHPNNTFHAVFLSGVEKLGIWKILI